MRLPFPGPVVLLVALLLGACNTTRLPNARGDMPEPIPGKEQVSDGVRARFAAQLRGLAGSSAQGAVNVSDKGDLVSFDLNLTNVMPGLYSWALHENGNCSSPNGASAGKPWAPRGVKAFPAQLLPDFIVKSDQAEFVTARVRGAEIGERGLEGRSVVIYSGGAIQELRPDVPNNAIACGVFVPVKPLF